MGLSRKGRKPTDLRGLANPDLVMARLESGLPLKDAVNRSYDGYYSHCKLHPAWARRAQALVERNAQPGKLRKLEQMGVLAKRAKTHCSRGHRFTPENTRLRTRCGGVQRECRQCERDRQADRGPLPKPEVLAKLAEALRRKLTFNSILRHVRNDCCAFYRAVRQVPELRALHEEWKKGTAERKARANIRTGDKKRVALVMDLLPAHLSQSAKLQIVGAVIEAHRVRRYRGKPFGITKTKSRIKEFIADYWRDNPTKAYGDIKTPWSLDAPLYDDGATTLADRATRSIWDEVPL